MRPARISVALVCLAALAGAPSALAAQPPSEPFFPGAGNSGYDALSYRVHLAYKAKGAGSQPKPRSKRSPPSRSTASASTSSGRR